MTAYERDEDGNRLTDHDLRVRAGLADDAGNDFDPLPADFDLGSLFEQYDPQFPALGSGPRAA